MCKCAQENCDLDIYENSGKCILHSEDKNKNIKEFWKEIREKISNIILIPSFLNSEKEIIIENIFFPRFERDFKLNTKQSNNSFFHKTEKIFELKLLIVLFGKKLILLIYLLKMVWYLIIVNLMA
jgi:hypothetical protein